MKLEDSSPGFRAKIRILSAMVFELVQHRQLLLFVSGSEVLGELSGVGLVVSQRVADRSFLRLQMAENSL